MNFLTSAYFVLIVISFGLTLFSGVTQKLPLWIPVLLISIALLIGAAR